MSSFIEASRSALARIGRSLADRMIFDRALPSNPRVSAGAKRYAQPLRLIPGMPAAPEPCLLPTRWSPETHPKNAAAQKKVDGIRAMYIDTSIVSREALPLDCALHCLPGQHDLEQLYGCKMVFDGEYQEPEGFQATIAAMRRGYGFGSTWLFDAVPYDDWARNHFNEPLEDRVARLCEKVEQLGSPFVRALGLTPVPEAADAHRLAEAEWARGGEGIVVKDARSLYQRGKSGLWQKVKQRQTFDGVIVDALVKDGRCQALMIRMPADSPSPGKVVRIGTNIPPELREAIARAGDSFQGSVAEIAFSDTTDTGNLRNGYFVRMRDDKKGGDNA